jgi:mannosyltransferase OCH1-like enzyme
MKLIISVARGFIKLTANLLKVGCYGVHWALPKKRFLIPSVTPALIVDRQMSIIPKTIWQTNFTDRVTLPVYLNFLFNRLMAPGFEHRFMVTQDRTDFVRDNYPEHIFEAYSRIQIGAAQADFWRVLVLQKYGGVYMDIDAHLVWPLSKIIPPTQEELFLQIKTGEISNYFVASKPDNPNLAKIINQIERNIELAQSENVYDLTGPGVFNQVLAGRAVPRRYYQYTCNQGNFTNEFFQYIDKPQGKWTREQEKIDVIRKRPTADEVTITPLPSAEQQS